MPEDGNQRKGMAAVDEFPQPAQKEEIGIFGYDLS
jgi:hypothetical protein